MKRYQAQPSHVAILINARAKNVNRPVLEKIRKFLPDSSIYLSHNYEEGAAHVRDIVRKGYNIVYNGGGDGSILFLINELKTAIEEENQAGQKKKTMPVIGILKLGTGNSWGYSVGIQDVESTLRWTITHLKLPTRRYNLIEVEDRIVHFAGLGWDALVLNDYADIKKEAFGIKEKFLGGLLGYFYSALSRTTPKLLFDKLENEVIVRNLGGRVYRVSYRNGLEPQEIPAGGIIYEGIGNVVGASTIPYYGFGLKSYPFSRYKEKMFQLRICALKPFEFIRNLPDIWTGRLDHPLMNDYLVEDVLTKASRPLAFQMGGDAKGYRDQIRYQVSAYVVDILDPYRCRLENDSAE